jgi:DNA-3-methyladenine glycosylase I
MAEFVVPTADGDVMYSRLVTGEDGRNRCGWCGSDQQYMDYHDTEWGQALHGESRILEKLCLEGAQAGLSWITILRKRSRYREVFAGFDPASLAEFTETDVLRLLADPGIVRNRAKIESAIGNARATVALLESGRSLDELCWSFAPPKRRQRLSTDDAHPTTCDEADKLSKELKRNGFRFVGPTTMYAFMQSAGMVDDHFDGCWIDPA